MGNRTDMKRKGIKEKEEKEKEKEKEKKGLTKYENNDVNRSQPLPMAIYMLTRGRIISYLKSRENDNNNNNDNNGNGNDIDNDNGNDNDDDNGNVNDIDDKKIYEWYHLNYTTDVDALRQYDTDPRRLFKRIMNHMCIYDDVILQPHIRITNDHYHTKGFQLPLRNLETKTDSVVLSKVAVNKSHAVAEDERSVISSVDSRSILSFLSGDELILDTNNYDCDDDYNDNDNNDIDDNDNNNDNDYDCDDDDNDNDRDKRGDDYNDEESHYQLQMGENKEDVDVDIDVDQDKE